MKENIDIINSKIMDLVKEISSLSADDKKTKVLDSYYRSALLSIVAFSDQLLTTDSLSIEDPNVIVLDHDPVQVEDPNKIVIEENSVMIDKPTDDNNTILLPVDPIEFDPDTMIFDNEEKNEEFVAEAEDVADDLSEFQNDPNVIVLEEDPIQVEDPNEIVLEDDPYVFEVAESEEVPAPEVVDEVPAPVEEETDLDDAMVDLITDENTIILENDPIPYEEEDVKDEMNLVAQAELNEASEDPNVILLDEDPSTEVAEEESEIVLEAEPTIEVETDEEVVA